MAAAVVVEEAVVGPASSVIRRDTCHVNAPMLTQAAAEEEDGAVVAEAVVEEEAVVVPVISVIRRDTCHASAPMVTQAGAEVEEAVGQAAVLKLATSASRKDTCPLTVLMATPVAAEDAGMCFISFSLLLHPFPVKYCDEKSAPIRKVLKPQGFYD